MAKNVEPLGTTHTLMWFARHQPRPQIRDMDRISHLAPHTPHTPAKTPSAEPWPGSSPRLGGPSDARRAGDGDSKASNNLGRALGRLCRAVATIAAAAAASIAVAQDGSPAAPATDTAAVDLSARQAPWGRSNIDLDRKDRVYAAGPNSNSVAVIDPSDDQLIATIPLADGGSPTATDAARGIRSNHALSYSPDGRTLAVTSQRSSRLLFVDTATDSVVDATILGAPPSGAFYTPNGREVWAPIAGSRRITVLDADSHAEIARIDTPDEAGVAVFSNDGRRAFVCSGSGVAVVDVRRRRVADYVQGEGPTCSSIAASPDGKQIWAAANDGRTTVISARPPFRSLAKLDTGRDTNGVNFVSSDAGQFAYVTVGGSENLVRIIDTQSLKTVSVLRLRITPSTVWPSGDGTRVYVGSRREDAVVVIDAAAKRVIDTIRTGSAADAVAFVPYAGRHRPAVAKVHPDVTARR